MRTVDTTIFQYTDSAIKIAKTVVAQAVSRKAVIAIELENAIIAKFLAQNSNQATDMWKGRALHMLHAALPLIAEYCENKSKTLTKKTLFPMLSFDTLVEISAITQLDSSNRFSLLRYFDGLPGFGSGGIQTAKTYHEYLAMVLSPAFNDDTNQ